MAINQDLMNKFIMDALASQNFQGDTGAVVSYAQSPMTTGMNPANTQSQAGPNVMMAQNGQTGNAPTSISQNSGAYRAAPVPQPVPTTNQPQTGNQMATLQDLAVTLMNGGSYPQPQGPLMPSVPRPAYGTQGPVAPPQPGAFKVFTPQGNTLPANQTPSGQGLPTVKVTISPPKQGGIDNTSNGKTSSPATGMPVRQQ